MSQQYGVIYADPPWWYNKRDRNGSLGGGVWAHYGVMRDQELLDMADYVKGISDENCALFMWTTGGRLDFGIDLLKAWGFRYCTVGFVWVKTTKQGVPVGAGGSYTSQSCEYVLIGGKGKICPARKLLPQQIISPRMEHSRKPELVRQQIDRMYPGVAKIELFSRREADGWTTWGNETGKIEPHPQFDCFREEVMPNA